MNTESQLHETIVVDTEVRPQQPQFAFVVDSDLAHVGGGSAVLLY